MAPPDAPLRAFLRRPFPEQIAAYRLRLGNLVPTRTWDELWQAAHDRAFMVAGATKADLLADLALAIDRAIAQGTGLDTFRREFRAIVEKHSWHGWTGEGTAAGEAWRTRVIYQTNMRTTYMAGRHAQLVAGRFRYWVYLHSGAEHPRLQHLAWNGLALPPEHPFWQVAYPPNGWGCGCRVRGANSRAGIRRLGGDPDKTLPEGWDRIDPSTGAPKGIGRGWAYAPGASAADTITLAAQKIARLPAEIGVQYGRSLDAVIDRYWPIWAAETRAGRRHEPALAGVLEASVVDALTERGIGPVSSEIAVRPGLLRGPKATRHENAGNALTETQWDRLPQLLRTARAVLIDPANGNLLFVIDGAVGAGGQLVLRLDYKTRIGFDTRTLNVVVSAYQAPIADLLGRLAGGLLNLLVGEIG